MKGMSLSTLLAQGSRFAAAVRQAAGEAKPEPVYHVETGVYVNRSQRRANKKLGRGGVGAPQPAGSKLARKAQFGLIGVRH